MAVDYREKYERLLRETLAEIESTVKTAQCASEEHSKASESCISTLKDRLARSQEETSELRRKLLESERRDSKCHGDEPSQQHIDALVKSEFLETLACLRVQTSESSSDAYTCYVTDGKITGHCFQLTLDRNQWEYTYTPIAVSRHVPRTSNLAEAMCFPDYMLSRFLLKLLTVTYKDTTHIWEIPGRRGRENHTVVTKQKKCKRPR